MKTRSLFRELLPAALLLVCPAAATETLDLSGEWKLALDPEDKGMAVTPDQWVFHDTIWMPSRHRWQ